MTVQSGPPDGKKRRLPRIDPDVQRPRDYLDGRFGHATREVLKAYTPPEVASVTEKIRHKRKWLSEQRAAIIQHRVALVVNQELANKDWAQDRLAREAGMSVDSINRVLRGQTPLTLRHVTRLEGALGIDLMPFNLDDLPERDPKPGPGTGTTSG